jgi:glycerol-3-phosphate dehydrogenase
MADEELDVLVIGGGITGCGVALDAALRGLRVGLVERDDFASGTSGRSSRLVHGGLRYLARAELGLVRESLRERAIVARLAPHLVRVLPIYVPDRRRMPLRVALLAYDALAAGVSLGRCRSVARDELADAVPGLRERVHGVQYHECPTDDARLTLEVARAAAAHGAHLANHAEVAAIEGARVMVRDTTTRASLDVRARVIVNATGVWSSQVQALASAAERPQVASKGVHLVFRPGAVRANAGVLIPSAAGDGRRLFVIPWEGRYYAGTTDTAYGGDLDAPDVDEADHEYVLAAMTRAFPDVGPDDVVATWAGLRPLAGGGDGPTTDLSRRHVVYEDAPGLLTVTGGKLTTFRAMAEDAVDRACRILGRGGECRTRTTPLGLTQPLEAALADARAAGAPERLVHRYGDDWRMAHALIGEDESLGEPVDPDAPVLAVERVLARTREMAMTDDDVDVRRTRLTTLGVRAAAPLG